MASIMTAGTARSARIMPTLAKRWYVVLVAVAVAALAAFALSFTVTPVYTSSTTLFFSLRSAGSATDINQGSAYTQNQMLSFAQLASSSLVLDQVLKDLGPAATKENIRRSMSVSAPQNTAILDISVGTTNRELSAKTANSIAKYLTAAVTKVSPDESTKQGGIVVNVIEPAVPAQFQSSPDKRKNALLGGMFGGALSILAIALTVMLDTRVRSTAVLKSMSDRPLLGTVEQNRASNDSRPVALRAPNGSATERFRQIKVGLRFAAASHQMKAIAITSAIPSEGKTLTGLNLAIIMAENKDRVLLIDADLRRPSVAGSLGFEGAVGLTTVLVGDVSFDDAVQHLGSTSLDVLAAGAIPPNPAELLGSEPMRLLLEEAKAKYDVVLVDTAPVLAVADVAVIAQLVDSIVWVVDSRKLHQAQLDQASEALDATGAHVAGIILNRVKPLRLHDVYYTEGKGEPAHLEKTRVPHSVVSDSSRAHISQGTD
ncbi:polysaccharide biosynthesis tyrosine autokinase [Arthrobacter psychrochitiniphilus]|nr:polysaccharide biosynthesis tyrosine autokinase [Arthrobacter psychrochitiniphilus]NYG16570.1 capsular exopolysaccharide synthesis family protein [Arthrobacter psychrochitiniphilus]